jgi:uncharacterized protein YaiI (UPF0178 family)
MAEFRIIVDADACPRNCLRIAQRLAGELSGEVVTVASINHQIDNPHHLVVGSESQAADIAVINLTRPGDIVVTQDWGLAAMVLGRKAAAISPMGRIFRDDQIEGLLEERNMMAKFRRSGGRTKGPSARNPEDDRRFEENLHILISRKQNLP